MRWQDLFFVWHFIWSYSENTSRNVQPLMGLHSLANFRSIWDIFNNIIKFVWSWICIWHLRHTFALRLSRIACLLLMYAININSVFVIVILFNCLKQNVTVTVLYKWCVKLNKIGRSKQLIPKRKEGRRNKIVIKF